MQISLKNTSAIILAALCMLGFSYTASAANIDSVQKYSQAINIDIDQDGTDDFINWSPTGSGATVTDTGITGYIWGESLGWINLNPSGSGVTNTCDGELGGMAWSSVSGWINFSPTGATIAPNINTTTGEITGQIWVSGTNGGWYELSSPDVGNPGLVTTWRGCADGGGGGGGGGGGTGGQTSTLRVYKQVVGGTAVPGDFILHVKEGGSNIVTPFQGSSTGNTIIIDTDSAHTYVVGEQASSSYDAVFSGNCAPYGIVSFAQGEDGVTKTCTITNIYKSVIYGCKDTSALNYDSNPVSIANNGLCSYPNNEACKDPAALNYNSNSGFTANNSLCSYKDPDKKYACKDPSALNYNSDISFIADNTACNYPESIYACKDPTALNYNSDSTTQTDNDLCVYPPKVPKDLKWVLAVIAVAGLVSALPGIVARAGHMLFTLVWGRKKIRGIVYDSQNKEPLDPVYVSVIDLITGQEVKNQLTDMEGRFGFVLPKGHYKITAGKTNYQFPSVKLAGRVSDEVYDRLYFGEPFTVENEEQVVSMNIPMDPVGTDWNQIQKHKASFLQYLVKGQTKFAWLFDAMFIIGFLVSIIITYFYPIWWNYVMTALYVIIGLARVYGYGSVYAGKVTKNGMSLGGAIVHIWNAKLNHEVAKRVTEVSGAYYVLVPKADYYVTIDQKNADGTFTKVYTSPVFHARHGCIDKEFSL